MRGLGGLLRAATIAEGGGDIKMRSSGTGSDGVSLTVGGADGSFGRAWTAVPHPNDGFLRTAPHPAERKAAEHITAKEIRAPERNGVTYKL